MLLGPTTSLGGKGCPSRGTQMDIEELGMRTKMRARGCTVYISIELKFRVLFNTHSLYNGLYWSQTGDIIVT
jgi:hypothetical protein